MGTTPSACPDHLSPGHQYRASGLVHRQKDASGNELNIWKRTLPDNSILTLTHNSPWTLVMEDGSTLQLGESQDDFQSGDFGITLLEEPDLPQIVITGDISPLDTNASVAGVQLGFDTLGNVKVSATPAPGRVDILYDGTGDEHILGLGGHDILYAARGGNDRLQGGDGNDAV